MHLSRLEIEGFLSLRKVAWTPGKLNVLIGPNAGGKSNLLKALAMISASARGELQKQSIREGGIDSFVWDGKAESITFRLGVSGVTTDELMKSAWVENLGYEFTMARLAANNFLVTAEALGEVISSPVDPLQFGQRAKFSKLDRSTPPAKKRRTVNAVVPIPVDERRCSETWLSRENYCDDHGWFDCMQSALRSWMIYQWFETSPSAHFRSAPLTRYDEHLEPDGQNLIGALHTLYTHHPRFKDDVNAGMSAAFGEQFEELLFAPAADGRIQMRVKWKGLDRTVASFALSDGTLRFLRLLTILADPVPPPLIAIDEPETGLHPSMLPIVADFAFDASRRSEVILTTHSTAMLDAFRHLDERPTVTVVQNESGETTLRVISGESLDYWLQHYALGELYQSGQLEAMT